MKINKFYMFTLLAIIILLNSCTDDKIVDQVFDTTTRGAILRTLSTEGPGYFNTYDFSTDFSVTFEAQDQQNGALLESVEVHLAFIDNHVNKDSIKITEILDTTIPASNFTNSSNGLPSTSIKYSMQEMIDKIGLVASDFTGGDQFRIRLVYELTDGRSFTNTDASGNIASGSFFRSPYLYLITLKCIPPFPVPGVYRVEMSDSGGDGWQTTSSTGGEGIKVDIDGTIVEIKLESGKFGDATVTIPNGATKVTWSFPGDFKGEISAKIFDPDGKLAAEIERGTPASTIVLNILSSCP